MARRPKVDPLDFSRNRPSWAEELRVKNQNATAEVDAVIAKLVEEGNTVTEQQRRAAIVAKENGRDFDFQFPVDEPEVPVKATKSSVEPEGDSSIAGLMTNLPAALGTGLADYFMSNRRAAQAIKKLNEITAEEKGSGIIKRLVRDVVGTDVSVNPLENTENVLRLISPGYRKVRLEEEQKTRTAEKAEALRVIEEEKVRSKSLEERLGGGLAARTARVLGGVSAQALEQAAPIVGGIVGGAPGAAVGSLPMANAAYDAAYREALEQFGATDDEATDYARAMTAVEFGTEAVGGKLAAGAIGKLGIKKLTKDAVQEALARKVKGRVGRVAGAGLAEGLEEVGAEATGDVIRAGMEAAGTLSTEESRDKLKKFNAEQAASRLDRYLDSFIGGKAAGVVIATPAAQLSYASELGKQQAETQKAAEAGFASTVEGAKKQEAEDLKADTELNEDIRLEQERIQQEQAKEDAFKKAEQDRAKEQEEQARQKEIEEEAAFRTIETEDKFRGQTRVERAGDSLVERVPVNPPAETTPAQVQAERESAKAEEAERLDRVELGGLTEQLRKRQDSLATKTAEEQAKADKKAKSAESRRRRVIMDQLIQENPDKAPADLAPLLRERLKAAPTPAEQAAEPTKTEDTRVVTPEMKAALRALKVPAATVDKMSYASAEKRLKTAPAAPQAIPEATKPDTAMEDKDIDDLAEGLSKLGTLNTKGTTPTTDTRKAAEAFKPKLARAIKNLVGRNTNQTADVQNLIRQQKVVFAPNPESIGRSETGAASYDIETGKMHVYLDRTDPDDVMAVIANTLHEATHAGQFNDREGRPSLLKQMMGQEKENAAKTAILEADGKNTLATRAVAAAKAASPDTDIQDLELVPYFVAEAVNARQGFGRLGGVVRDIKAGAKGFMREQLGVDLDVSLADIDSAAQKVAGEVVKTDVQPSLPGRGALQIEAGPKATGFREAQREQETYEGLDKRSERFEFSDDKAELYDNGDSLDGLVLKGPGLGSSTTMYGILEHDKLYENYPWIKKLKVQIEDLGPTAQGYFDAMGEKIVINNSLLRTAAYGYDLESRNKAKEEIRLTLLHEAQHAIQTNEGWVEGANAANFLPAPVVNDKARAEERMLKVIQQFDLGAAVNKLPPEAKRLWENEVRASNSTSPDQMKALFLDEGYWADTGDRMAKRYAESTYTSAANQLAAANLAYKKAEEAAFRLYLRDQGEAASRNVELRSRMNPMERTATPFNETLATDTLSKRKGITKEELIDTTPFVGGRNLPASSSLQSAGISNPRKAWEDSRVREILLRTLSSSLGAGPQVQELMEHANSAPSKDRMMAEQSLAKYHNALGKEAARRGMTATELNNQIGTEIEVATQDTKGYKANKAAFDSVVDKYGSTGAHLKNLRDQIDTLTKEIVRQRIAQGDKLTTKEENLYNKMLSNLGKYNHRQYATNLKDVGDKYSKAVWDAYSKGKQKTTADKANFNRVANAVDWLINHELMIPEDLDAVSDERIRNLHGTWVGGPNANDKTTAQKREELEAVRDNVNNDPARIKAQAERTVQEILGVISDPGTVATYFRGGKRDNTIIKQRENIPSPLRELMGEVKDVGATLMVTAAKQAEFIARTNMFMELTKVDDGSVAPPSAVGTPAVENKVKLEGETYGPMEGWYVVNDLKLMLDDAVAELATFDQATALAVKNPRWFRNAVLTGVADKWAHVAGVSKALQIIVQPFNFAWNYVGAYGMMLINGNISPSAWLKGHKAIVDVVANAMSPAYSSEILTELNQYGVTDSAFVGDLKAEQHQQLARVVKEMAGKSPSQAMAALGKIKVGGKELYAMMDVWSKAANFYHQVDLLNKFYKAEGIPRTDAQIRREAADITNRTNLTYKRAAPIVRGIEAGGGTAYGVYFYEVFRTQVNNLSQAYAELKRANEADTYKGRLIMGGQATKRLAGQAAFWTGMGYVARAAAQMVFGDEDEEDKRSLLPEWMQDQDFLPIGLDKNGNMTLFQLSRVDPIGPITDLMRAVINKDADLEEVGGKMFDLYVAPRLVPQVVTAVKAMTSDTAKVNREPTLKLVAPDAWSEMTRLSPLNDKVDRALWNIAEAFSPGFVTSWRESNARPAGKDPASQFFNVMTYMGLNLYKMDAKAAATTQAFAAKDQMKAARDELALFFDDHPDATPKEVASLISELEAQEQKGFEDLSSVYRGAKAIGMDEAEITKSFLAAGLSRAQITAVRSSKFTPTVVSDKSFETRKAKDLANANTDKERALVEAEWKKIGQIVEVSQKSLEEEE